MWRFLLATSVLAEPEISTRFLQKRDGDSETPDKCGGLELEQNELCRDTVLWVAERNGKYHPKAPVWFKNFESIAGVPIAAGNVQDYQRLYWCAPPGGKYCGLPPCSGCSSPPCDDCFAGKPLVAHQRPGCAANDTSIGCIPPETAMGYKGQHWPTTYINGTQEMHIFLIGDWGGLDGTLDTNQGRPELIAYDWGRQPGPSVFPRSRWNKRHTERICSHKEFIECFNTFGEAPCEPGCGFVKGVDDKPQLLVAEAFKERAALKDPQYVLNVGDNFYWGGIEKTCGFPMNMLSYPAKHQFDEIFEGIYQGPGLSGKPWFGVLGNHDWGGFRFDNGWDQQMSYTWFSDRWVLPAPYYKTSMVYKDLGFDVDIYFLDTNFMDAKKPEEDPSHNMCSLKNNKPSATCSAAGGPESIETCPGWFEQLWKEQKEWIWNLLPQSTATWRFVVTHFPCGHEQLFYQRLRRAERGGKGLDLLITGHRHDQELWRENEPKNWMGMACIVTGGGGGITSEATPNPNNTVDWYGEGQYGFYDLTISKTELLIESINYDGDVLLTHTIYPQ